MQVPVKNSIVRDHPNLSHVPPETAHNHANSRYSHGLVHKICSLHRLGVIRPRQLGQASLRSLLLGCVSDLRTCLVRMGQRFDKLPEAYSVEVGPSIQRDASGHLRANTRTRACIENIRSFEVSHPGATVFDVEVFRQGWEMGARWSENTIYRTAQDRTA